MKQETLDRVDRSKRAAQRVLDRAEPMLRYLEQIAHPSETMHHVTLLVKRHVMHARLVELKKGLQGLSGAQFLLMSEDELAARQTKIETAETEARSADKLLDAYEADLLAKELDP